MYCLKIFIPLNNYRTIIKIRKLTWTWFYYLIYRPYSEFTIFVNNVPHGKRKFRIPDHVLTFICFSLSFMTLIVFQGTGWGLWRMALTLSLSDVSWWSEFRLSTLAGNTMKYTCSLCTVADADAVASFISCDVNCDRWSLLDFSTIKLLRYHL